VIRDLPAHLGDPHPVAGGDAEHLAGDTSREGGDDLLAVVQPDKEAEATAVGGDIRRHLARPPEAAAARTGSG
jgi:hypothetical protein